MEVKNLVKEVATLLQLSNVLALDLDDVEELQSMDDLTERDVNLIVNCLNQTLTTIATEYIELLTSENITVVNGEFDLDDLEKNFYKIKRVENNEKFEIVDNKLRLNNGNYKIIYSYYPEELELNDEFDFYENLSKYAICYGICSQYCLILGDFAQSETWESKFENAMEMAKSQLKVMSIKNRRWA